jgi:signal transduction histidine kinase
MGLRRTTNDSRRATYAAGEPARLAAQLLEAREAERRTLSRDLHDGIGQSVTALKMELAGVKPGADADSAERLLRARAMAGDVLETVRNIAALLRPSILDDLGLAAALDWHVQEFAKRTGIACRLECAFEESEPDDLSEPVRTCIYRVVQEALNNCEKYAAASIVKVVVNRFNVVPPSVVKLTPIRPARARSSETAGQIVVTIADNGRGFSPGLANSRGMGIAGMKERAALAGGTLAIESSKGKGTTVVLSIPANSSGARAGSARS